MFRLARDSLSVGRRRRPGNSFAVGTFSYELGRTSTFTTAMSVRRTAFVGSVVGLVVSVMILVILWNFGISSRVRLVLWPSSVMLRVDWCCTVPGILTTIFSIAINCLIYAAIALLLGAGIRAVTPQRGTGN